MTSAGSRRRRFMPAIGPALLFFWSVATAACGSSSGSVSRLDGAGGAAAGDVADAAPEIEVDEDAGAGDAGADLPADLLVEFPPAPQPYPRPTYEHLSETGLY